jgi:tetratricopeptide (TPR) repeat protein
MPPRGRLLGTTAFCLLLTQALPAAAQQTDPRAKTAYAQAVQLEAHGNTSAALPLLWDAAGLAPHDPDIQNRLGEALERIGALDAAVTAYRAAVAARPSFTQASNHLILALVKAGRAPEAIARARTLVADAPGDAERSFTLGLAQSEADVPEAIKTFRHVLELAPRHTLTRYNLALVLQRADRQAEAIAELERALAIEARPEAYYALGVIHWHQGDFERAATALRSAIAQQADYADAHFTLGAVLRGKQDWSGAAAALRRAIKLRPDLGGAHYTLGQVLQSQGDLAGARREFAEAERLRLATEQSQEAGVWTAVGTEKLDSGELTGAVECFRRATAVFPAFAPAHYQLGRALLRLGQRDAARAAFARAQQLNPSLVSPSETR